MHAALSFSGSSDAGSSIFFCKCICFSNYTILPLYRPSDPAKPCLSCTKYMSKDTEIDPWLMRPLRVTRVDNSALTKNFRFAKMPARAKQISIRPLVKKVMCKPNVSVSGMIICEVGVMAES